MCCLRLHVGKTDRRQLHLESRILFLSYAILGGRLVNPENKNCALQLCCLHRFE